MNSHWSSSVGNGVKQPDDIIWQRPPARSSGRTALIWISTFTVTHYWSHAHGRPRALLTNHLIRLNEHLRGPTVEEGDVLKAFTAAAQTWITDVLIPQENPPSFSGTLRLCVCVCVWVCAGVKVCLVLRHMTNFFSHTSL